MEKERPTKSARISAESVQVVAQMIPNLLPLSEPAAVALAPDAEYRIRELIQDGVKFMRHSKRTRLTTGDINAALRLRNEDPIYGFGSKKRKRSAIDSARETSAREVIGQPSAAHLKSRSEGAHDTKFQQVDGIPELFVVQDTEESIKALIQQPLPNVPLEVAISSHWLAVDGKQPAIAQNPSKRAKTLGTTDSGDVGRSSLLPNRSQTEVEVKPIVKHDLSRELQLYYEQAISAVHSDDAALLESVLNSVAEEPGVAQVLPYFTRYIEGTVGPSLQNLPLLLSLMRLTNAVMTNEVFDLEKYAHQLLAPVLSCLVGKKLFAHHRENHWALRDYSAMVIQRMCEKLTKTCLTVQSRIAKTLVNALQDTNKSLTTHYGAIIGIASLGKHVVDTYLRPLLPAYLKKVEKVLFKAKPKSIRRYEACKIFGAITWALSYPVSLKTKSDKSFTEDCLLSKQLIRPQVTISEANLSEIVSDSNRTFQIMREDLGTELFPYGSAKSEAALSEYVLKRSRSKINVV